MGKIPAIADIRPMSWHVHFVPCVDGSELARAFFTYAALVGAAMCSAFKVRHTRPLAIMPSADQVPVNSSHSTMRWHKWVVLIAGSTGSASVSYTHLRAHE